MYKLKANNIDKKIKIDQKSYINQSVNEFT
jgi:hypothetical protein